jgi:hypothetical protein
LSATPHYKEWKNVNAYLEDVVVEKLLHNPLALQVHLEEDNKPSYEGDLPHQVLVASGLEPGAWSLEMQFPCFRILASCRRENSLAGYLVLDLVL